MASYLLIALLLSAACAICSYLVMLWRAKGNRELIDVSRDARERDSTARLYFLSLVSSWLLFAALLASIPFRS